MTAHQSITAPVFPADTLARMAALYPLQAGLLHHNLPDHPLLAIEALAQLSESLPASEVEYNPGDVPIGILSLTAFAAFNYVQYQGWSVFSDSADAQPARSANAARTYHK